MYYSSHETINLQNNFACSYYASHINIKLVGVGSYNMGLALLNLIHKQNHLEIGIE